MSTGNDNEETNPYLALRQAKIARNQARLKELGLVSSVSNNKPLTKKSRPASKETQKQDEAPVIVRRSKRISRQPQQPDGNESNEKPLVENEPENNPDPLLLKRRPKRPRSSEEKTSTPTPPAPNSVRAIDLDPERLVLGNIDSDGDDNDDDDYILGVPMKKTGKEFVIYSAFERGASKEDQDRLSSSRLSFNKYSGVQEWKNVIFLWVNLGAPGGGTVVNDFLENGRQITWFGGSRMQEDTPVVQKLISFGKGATSAPVSSPIILWCRLYNRTSKSFDPYVCLGRLSYHSHVPDSYPVSFVWNLLDYDKLMGSENESVRKQFQACLRIS